MYYKYKIQNLLSNEAKLYKNFIMVKLDLHFDLKIMMSKQCSYVTAYA